MRQKEKSQLFVSLEAIKDAILAQNKILSNITNSQANKVNPTGTYDKLKGHLGSMLTRKATDILTVTRKVNDRTGFVSYEVALKKSRGHQDFDNIKNLTKWLQASLFDLPQPCSLKDVERVLQANGVRNADRLHIDCQLLLQRGVLTEQPREDWQTGQRTPKYYIHLC